MAKPLIVCVSSSFPYGTGEQFLEAELPYWRQVPVDLVLLPEKFAGQRDARDTLGIPVDDRLVTLWDSRSSQLRAALEAFISGAMFRECAQLVHLRRFSRLAWRYSIRSTIQMKLVERALRELAAERSRRIDAVYAYWMFSPAMAAASLKESGVVRRAMCRTHRADLWEENRPGGHLPLVRQYAKQIDAVYPIAAKGAEYVTRFGFTEDQIRCARLGVSLPSRLGLGSTSNAFVIVTISSMAPVKRLDLMIDTIAALHRYRPDLTLSWHHFGSGPLASDVEHSAAAALPDMDVTFHGHTPHGDVQRFLLEEEVDCLINTSDSEGIPVSMMEAMACGIPSLGRDVGGVTELIPPWLVLSNEPSGETFGKQIATLVERIKSDEARQEARHIIETTFDADRNFSDFVSDVCRIATND